MLVVADSSPINVLVRVAAIDVLPSLFGRVAVPVEVRDELSSSGTPAEVRAFMAAPPAWLSIETAPSLQLSVQLGRGETAAISLASAI